MSDSTAPASVHSVPWTPRAVALIGPGRAGTSVATALHDRGVRITAVAGREPGAPSTVNAAVSLGARAASIPDVVRGSDLVVVATPDAAVEHTAAGIADALEPGALVVHLSGAQGVGALAAIDARRCDVLVGALHPLQTLPSGPLGAARLEGAWAAVAGPPRVTELATFLGLRPFHVDDADRAAYHAAACIAANHAAALLAQVQRVAAGAGVPLEAFEPLVRATVDNVFALGPAAALTGPVARGDVVTVAGHLDSLADDERDAYRALAAEALRVAGGDDAMRSLLEQPHEVSPA